MRKRVSVCAVILMSALILSVSGSALGATHDVFFTPDMLSYDTVDSYDVVRLEGGRLLTREGHPMLPMSRVAVSIPYDCRVTSYEIVPVETMTIEGDYWIYPASPPSRPTPTTSRWTACRWPSASARRAPGSRSSSRCPRSSSTPGCRPESSTSPRTWAASRPFCSRPAGRACIIDPCRGAHPSLWLCSAVGSPPAVRVATRHRRAS